MAPTLDDLINDDRLGRLFSKDARACALQLWILQIKSEQSIENRVIYGRLLPYSHSSNRWSASDDDAFKVFDNYLVQVRRLNLYVNSTQCAALLRGVSAGRSVTETLVTIAEEQAADLPAEPESPDVMRLSLLSQMVSEIALAVQFDISGVQREYLLRSGNGLLQWMGLITMEMQLEQPQGLDTVLQWVGTCNSSDKVRILGWMAHRAARNPDQLEICQGLIAALHAAVPTTLSAKDLRHVVDSMRGHMRELAWAEPCLFQDVVFPLLRNGRANGDDACEIWMKDLTGMLVGNSPLLFNQAREGQMTNISLSVG